MGKVISIIIKGEVGTGKSVLAEQIAGMLERYGLSHGDADCIICLSTNGGLSNLEEEGHGEFTFFKKGGDSEAEFLEAVTKKYEDFQSNSEEEDVLYYRV